MNPEPTDDQILLAVAKAAGLRSRYYFCRKCNKEIPHNEAEIEIGGPLYHDIPSCNSEHVQMLGHANFSQLHQIHRRHS